MSTTKPKSRSKTKSNLRYTATRNGVPCSLDTLECRATGFDFKGRVLFPLPLPPSDPYVFRTLCAAERAIARTEKLSRKVRGSIIRDFVLGRFPTLKTFATEAAYKTAEYKKSSN